MFEWYQESTVCYVYLQDVYTSVSLASSPSSVAQKYEELQKRFRQDLHDRKHALHYFDLRSSRDNVYFSKLAKEKGPIAAPNYHHSRWFARGWTLQELLAPKSVEFYTNEWDLIGTKTSLSRHISASTGIPVTILRGESFQRCSVAQRMSWASQRQTTREEDTAYCLLGLFGVNMPLLYGEGRRAFIRLQEETMKLQEDYSILAWSLQYDCSHFLTGLLATSPRDFSRNVPSELLNPERIEPPEVLYPGRFGLSEQLNNDRRRRESRLQGWDAWLYRSEEDPLKKDDPWYQILSDKNYDHLQPHVPYRITATEAAQPNVSLEETPKEPIELTSRGLRLSIPIRRPTDAGLPSIAWLYCQYDNRLLCIGIQRVKSSRLYARHSAPWLITVDPAKRKEFVREDFFAISTGLLSLSDSSDGLVQSIPRVSKTWGRVKLFTSHPSSDYITLALGMHPPANLHLDEFFYQEGLKVAGAVEFHCFHEKRRKSFVVLIGFLGSQSWCDITPNREGVPLQQVYQEHADKPDSETKRLSEMAVCVLDDNWCFYASIRKRPSSGDDVRSYALHARGCPRNEQPSWVSVYLSERQ